MKVRGIRNYISKNSASILAWGAVLGLAITAWETKKASVKAKEEIDQRNEELADNGEQPLTKVEEFQFTWPLYLKPLYAGVLTAACILGSNKIHLERTAGYAGAYEITKNAYRRYQDSTKELVGEKKEREIRDTCAQKALEEASLKLPNTIEEGNGHYLCYDTVSGREFTTNVDRIKSIENELNARLIQENFIPLNSLYYALGLRCTKMGNKWGWNIKDGMIDLSVTSAIIDDKPWIVLDYDFNERYNEW